MSSIGKIVTVKYMGVNEKKKVDSSYEFNCMIVF